MAEDEDEDELFGATAPSPSAANSRRARPTLPPASDFESRPHQQQGGALEMAEHSGPSSPEQSGPSTEPSQTDPESTTAPATTAAPDPDAVVCSGRPFDSFMQVKNGSIFAFRGEPHAFSDVSKG